MSIPINISMEHIAKAISEIDSSKIPSHRLEKRYSLVENGKQLPPKYVISIANRFANEVELGSDEFNAVEAKDFLIKLNLNVIDKHLEKSNNQQNVWVEKTIVNGRVDRKEGERALGKALWSSQKSTGGADIYKNMREVKKGDIILHLIDNEKFSGVSVVKTKADETNGIEGTDWDRPSYLIELENYIELVPPIKRGELLNVKNKSELLKISKSSEVFYNSNLNLRQGAYLTPCPIDLLFLINKTFNETTSQNLPHIERINFQNTTTKRIAIEINKIKTNLINSGLQIADKLVTRFICSLLAKPFVILTGLSGSGKTKLAQAFAMWICENEGQYCIIPVGADWTNREPLLGFPNALQSGEYVKPDNGVLDLLIEASKDENKSKPYFLILDEMNLSHVERYFADFLSVMETKKNISLHSGKENWNEVPPELSIPKNLFIIGTVNIDETTYMFSPKVLDRANVIEFRVTAEEMEEFLKNIKSVDLKTLKSGGADMAEDFVKIAKDENITFNEAEDLNKELMNFFKELKNAGAEFGYRSASEILRFAGIVNKLEPEWKMEDIIDSAIMQKLLPKVHGSRRKLEPVLKTLGNLCLKDGKSIDKYISTKDDLNSVDVKEIKYPVSLEKILRMYNSLISNGFTSYAEA